MLFDSATAQVPANAPTIKSKNVGRFRSAPPGGQTRYGTRVQLESTPKL